MTGGIRILLLLMVLNGFVRGDALMWVDPDGLGTGDYARDRLGSAWEMDSSAGLSFNQLTNITFDEGVMSAQTTGNDPWIRFSVDPWDFAATTRYRSLAVRIKRESGGAAWFHWQDQEGGWHNQLFQCADNEWTTIVVDMNENSEWSGSVASFRLDPASTSGITFWVDWVSITEGEVADQSFDLKWDLVNDATATFQYTHAGQQQWADIPGGTQLPLQVGRDSLTWDTSTLTSDWYRIRAVLDRSGALDTTYCGYPVRVDRTPVLTMYEPSEPVEVLEGMEFSSLCGDAWDMAGATDIQHYSGFSGVSFTNGVFSGQTLSDPYVILAAMDSIDTAIYYTLAWYMRVTSETLYQVNWRDDTGAWKNIPLSKSARAGEWALYAVDLSQHAGWSRKVTQLRIDPATASGIDVEIDWVRLAAPQTITVDATWQGTDQEGMATITFYCQDSTGVRYAVAEDLGLSQLNGQHMLDLWPLNPGLYHVVAEVDDDAHPLARDTATGDITVQMRPNYPPQVTVLTPNQETPRLPDVPEFSRDVIEDPWDFTEITDAMLYTNMTVPTIYQGVLAATSTNNDPHFWLLFQGYESAQNIGKTGQTYPVDPTRFKLLSFKMYVDTASQLQVLWYKGVNGPTGSASYATSEGIPVSEGWHTYAVRLDTLDYTSSGLGGWASDGEINGLRIDPTIVSGSYFEIDWFRLSRESDTSTETEISWIVNDDLQNSLVEVYYTTDSHSFGGDRIWGPLPATGTVQSFSYSTAHLPYPGGYVYVTADDQVNPLERAYAPGPLRVNAVPLLWVREPDELGPKEYAIEVQGNSWDMDGWDDIHMLQNVENAQFVDGVLWGNATSDDAQVFLTLTDLINTRRYGAVHVREWTDVWHVMRLLWRHTVFSQWQVTDDFVVYPGWNEFTIPDLAKVKLEQTSQLGWSGNVGGYFRIDPKELAGSSFGVDYLYLYTHDMTEDSFWLTWELDDADDSESPVDLSWYWRTSPESPDSTFIAAVSDVSSGRDSLLWDMTTLSSGEYWVHCIADDGLNAVLHKARGVLILNREPSFEFIEPDGHNDSVEEGDDFATSKLADPWDMDSSSDIDVVYGFQTGSITWQNGLFHGVTAVDPAWSWIPPTETVIDADNYKTVSFRMYLDDPQDRPLLMMFLWKYTLTGDWQSSAFIPAREGWNTYVVDVGSHYPGTWTGIIRHFRIDPVTQEDVTVELDWVRLTAPGSAQFLVTWTDGDPDDSAIIDLRAYSDSWQGDELTVGLGIQEDNETDALSWDLSPFPEGSYYLAATIDDGINAPLVAQCPFPVFVGPSQLLPVQVDVAQVAQDTLLLSWNSAGSAASNYKIYRASEPYFTTTQMLAIDMTENTWYRAYVGSAVGNPFLNYFYAVTWVDQTLQESPQSNSVGEWDFSLDQ